MTDDLGRGIKPTQCISPKCALSQSRRLHIPYLLLCMLITLLVFGWFLHFGKIQNLYRFGLKWIIWLLRRIFYVLWFTTVLTVNGLLYCQLGGRRRYKPVQVSLAWWFGALNFHDAVLLPTNTLPELSEWVESSPAQWTLHQAHKESPFRKPPWNVPQQFNMVYFSNSCGFLFFFPLLAFKA